MTDKIDEVPTLSDVSELRRRVRWDRHGFWFPLVVFGALTLLSTPLYWSYPLNFREHCHHLGAHAESCVGYFQEGSGALSPGYSASGLGEWITYYWIIALVLGYVLTVWFYRRRASEIGVAQRVAPAVFVGVGVLVIALLINEFGRDSFPALLNGDFWSRGTASLVILSLGLLALAILERSVGYVVLSLGFVGLALLASLYNLSNLVAGSGFDTLGDGRGAGLVNLIIPGLYLVLGGFLCWALQHDRRRRHRGSGAE